MAVFYVFATALHSSLLGALLTFAPRVWYPFYVERSAAWGLSPLEDQQLAGLIMWVPSGAVFVAVGLALFAAWLGESERRAGLSRTEQLRQVWAAQGPKEETVADRRRWRALALLAALALGAAGCNREGRLKEEAARMTGGDPDQGPQLIRKYGCSACHLIPGIEGARGMVGPPLNGIASRTYLGGQLPNTPQNMMRWIQDPQSIERGTSMPNVGVSHREARHIAAYLYTLR